ncbi:mitochondrial arginine transporter BAC2-like [Vicia villosa]|uniref:mitochondrial arginine transporter BAC2-like n=1 Tax=Vicia villosa TaxID=3911 RepID=UPI00273BA330|nr:mitochondrial arginine transporter BAC2-like [Vicia villosa]
MKNNVGREFVAGGFGGTTGIIASYPLDTLRVMQQQSGKASAVGILRNLLAKEGPSALYRGMAVPLASVGFQNAMIFQSYSIFTRICSPSISSNGPPSLVNVVLGGLGAGAIQSMLMSPVELVKIRMQLQKNVDNFSENKKNTPLILAKNIWKNEGLCGIYRGFGITVLRDAPALAFYFGAYEYTREKLNPGCRDSCQESVHTMFIAGGVAGIASWIFNYPTDVIKTRLQAQTSSSLKYKGILDCALKIIKEEGLIVLWRGLGATLVRAFIMNSAIFPTYQVTLRCLTNN